MKILVTGANGPLGQAVRDLAAYSGNGYNFLFTGSQELELTNMEAVNRFFQFERPDIVFHLAAKSGGAKLNKLIPVDMFEKNIKMSMNILGAAAKLGVKKTILVSSTSAYPALRLEPARESDLNAGPPSSTDYPYAYAKRMMDPLARAYRDQYGMQVSVAIVNGIVGPHMNFKKGESVMLAGLIRSFYEQKQFGNSNEHFLVQGDGTPVREYTYSLDLAKALFWIAEMKEMPELINIGNSQGLSVREYAEIICHYLDINPHKLAFSEPEGSQTPMYNQLTSNLYFKQLSNFDFTDIKSAIKSTIDWFTKNYEMIVKCG